MLGELCGAKIRANFVAHGSVDGFSTALVLGARWTALTGFSTRVGSIWELANMQLRQQV